MAHRKRGGFEGRTGQERIRGTHASGVLLAEPASVEWKPSIKKEAYAHFRDDAVSR